jgi:RND family efflux transporter MFP subunit
VVQLGGAAAPAAGNGLGDLLSAAGGGLPAGAGLPGLGGAPAAGTQPGVDPAVAVGAPVAAGTAIVTVVDVSELGLVAEVDETDILLVTVGLPATVELDAAPGAGYDAVVRSVDVLPTASARGGVAYRVRLSLRTGKYADGRAAPSPRPGMSAVARLRVREVADVVTVPAAAVFTVDGADVIWVIRDGKAERIPVTLGAQGQELVQVVNGVQAGDRIVVRGTDQVRAGQQVP